jgi:diguanylate cyclase (GGDEF)-like protein
MTGTIIAGRVVKALGNDPTQAFVLLDRSGQPVWASPSLFTLIDVDLHASDPFADALHPADAELCGEIFHVEKQGVADTSFDMDRRFELLVRVRSPRGGWNVVALRLLNYPDDPDIDGMLLQVTMANQEHSTVQAFDAAALGEPINEVLTLVLETICSGGAADVQAALFDQSDVCIAATRGAVIAPGDLRHGERWSQVAQQGLDLSIPVVGPSAGRRIGVLESVSNFPDVRPFTRELTHRVARRVGLLLEAHHTREELRRQANTDALTGLQNRRVLYEHLARTDLQPWASVAFVDLNGFKEINDRFGHSIGDDVLREVANRLRDSKRASDLLCRIGGDEFVVVRHGDGLADASFHAASLANVVDGDLCIGDVRLLITASVGVASGPSSDMLTLLTAADMSMYAAKPHRRSTLRESVGAIPARG